MATLQSATAEDLGKRYVDPYGEEWELIAYCDQPTFCLQRVNMASPYDHTRNSVVGKSEWASTWTLKE